MSVRGWEARWERAMTERITLALDQQTFSEDKVRIGVIGTKGNLYYVTIEKDKQTTCSCPDCHVNGFFCKHLILVLAKVLNVPHDILFSFQTHTSTIYLEKALQYCQKRHRELEILQLTLKDLESHKRRPLTQESECAICTELMEDVKDTDWCYVCGNSVHQGCFAKWNKLSCVYCRSEWHKLALK